MNLLAAYPLAHALGWTLLHFCWEGTVVALLLWCVLGAFGMRSPRLRYGASCAALALMVVLPLATFARLALEDYRLAALARQPIQAADIFFDDHRPVLMTEKDAVKCAGIAGPDHWYVPVEAGFAGGDSKLLLDIVTKALHERAAQA